MKKKIFVRGPVLSQSGYGEQSRFALRALRTREDLFDIYLQPTSWGKTGWVWKEDEFREWMDARILGCDVVSAFSSIMRKRLQGTSCLPRPMQVTMLLNCYTIVSFYYYITRSL